MDELTVEAKALEGLSALKPTPARRALVEQALASKWEGTQSIALTTLGAWGGRETVEAIRRFLEEAFNRKAGWSIRGVAIRALMKAVGPEDAGWVTALYNSRTDGLEKHELRRLVEHVSTMKR
jgi:hypothetical protein